LRRKKSVVAADLPPKSIIDVFCPLSGMQRDMYGAMQTRLQTDDADLAARLEQPAAGDPLTACLPD
jgi:SNF2 family DNA or RNA helicase